MIKDTEKNMTEEKEELLNIDDSFRLADLYFKQKNIMYSHLHNSFDKMIDEDIKQLLRYGDNTFYEKITETEVIKYKFKYGKIDIIPPKLDEYTPMFPHEARIRSLVYGLKIVATVTQIQERTDITTDQTTREIVGEPEHNVPIMTVPVMVRSKYCNLNLEKDVANNECDYDPGGYFIVNGTEKIIVPSERKCDNKPLVFQKKDSNVITYKVQVNSKSYKPNGPVQQTEVRIKKDNKIIMLN